MKKYFKLYKLQFIMGPAFKLAEAILELLVPLVVARIIDVGIPTGDKSYILKMGGLMLLLAFLGVCFALVCQYCAAYAQQGVGTHLRDDLFEKINKMSSREREQFGTASLTTRITNDVTQIQSAVAMIIRLVFRSPFLIAGSLIAAAALDLKMSIIFIAAAVIVSAILYFILSRSLPMYKKIQKGLDRLALIVKDNLSGVRVVRAFSKGEYEKERFESSNAELTERYVKAGNLSVLLNPLTFAVLNTAIVLILHFGGIKVNAGSLSQGQVIAFTNYMTQILLSIIVFSNVIVILTKAGASYLRVKEILECELSLTDENSADAQPDYNKNAVEFDGVDFSYGESEEKALESVDFSLKAGQTLGVIGGTGCGKSTLVNLIPRFYDVNAGSVRVFGSDVKEYKLDTLRSIVHIVPQKNVLFSGTVKENLLLANENADEAEINHALEISQAAEFVSHLPDGIDTYINEESKNISGGQRQRLCIARALMGSPKILILDDSSSALDFATDAKLRKALKEKLTDTTVILVSQRVNTVKNADNILVIDDGKIQALGTHAELVRTSGIYREICLSQLSESEVDGI